MGVYPENICSFVRSPKNAGPISDANYVGRSASFNCGAAVLIAIRINGEAASIEAGFFRTSGCGYAVAAADFVVSFLSRRALTDLHSLSDEEMLPLLIRAMGEFPDTRSHCVEMVLDAARGALAEYRRSVVSEFQGDSPLVCSCFGVSEDRIVAAIRRPGSATVEDIGRAIGAGTGCGSCMMVIQGLIDEVYDPI